MCVLSSLQVLKILQKLKDLDITLDILAETGIGKTVNSFRRHEQAGELAKSLIKGWKKLVPKDSTSLVEGNLEDTPQKSRFDSVEKRNVSESGRLRSNTKSKPSKESKGPFSFECSDESRDKMLKQAKDDRSSGISRSPKPEESKKKMRQEKHNKKTKTKDKESKRDQEEPSMSFESCLNYDVNSDFCDVSEESAVFTGQRLNRKMQVYSGAKTTFLPAMLSLYQQCIRTLQNNINLLYETGGVPFELLEPVLERCTPEQLQRIEESAQATEIYIGVTDHLWGKHCEKDFKDAKLQEYESWKEMYIRLSEERERKLQRLTKTIVLAHSKKPKGGCCTPRTVPLLNETIWDYQKYAYLFCCLDSVIFDLPALCSLKFLNVVLTGVAPMMAKSLKAFKKQLGRR
uniref:Elongin A, like n=1 Tax=Acanthochromis polyacanthus TaxID=80966 RepID=A0A3Q1GQE2_9TELE